MLLRTQGSQPSMFFLTIENGILVITASKSVEVMIYPQCRHTFATLSFLAEIFIFLYVGMDALDIEKWRFVSNRYSGMDRHIINHKNALPPSILHNYIRIIVYFCKFLSFSPKTSISVSAALLGLVLVGRAAFVFPLSFLSNLTKKIPHEKISFKEQVRFNNSRPKSP